MADTAEVTAVDPEKLEDTLPPEPAPTVPQEPADTSSAGAPPTSEPSEPPHPVDEAVSQPPPPVAVVAEEVVAATVAAASVAVAEGTPNVSDVSPAAPVTQPENGQIPTEGATENPPEGESVPTEGVAGVDVTPSTQVPALPDAAGEDVEPGEHRSELQAQPSITMLSHSASSAESGDDQPVQDDTTTVKVEKQPTIGQLQLKELLSGTSMAIVEHAQKLAEAPLIGTTQDESAPPTTGTLPGPPPDGSSQKVPVDGSQPSQISEKPVEVVTDQSVTSAEKKPTIPELIIPKEDQFPGPDHDSYTTAQPPPLLTGQEEELTDTEPYEAYTVPEGMEKSEDVPSLLKRYLQLYNDEKQPIAKFLKLEDEEKLNEAALWDIQPSYQLKPTCVIRVSVLEKVLRGILEFRLGKFTKTGMEPKQVRQIMPVLTEDVASSLAQCRFPNYKHCYFISIVPKNRQDVIISTRQIWDPVTDRRIIAKMDNRKFHASVIVHFLYHP